MGFALKRGYNEAENRLKAREERRAQYARRFWMRAGDTTHIIFLDDDPAIIDEHRLKVNGRWVRRTCLQLAGEKCPMCAARNRPQTIGYYTILDLTEWEDAAGNKHTCEKSLYGATLDILRQLKKISSKRNGLVGAKFEVTRTGEKSPSCGNMFEFEEKLSRDELLALSKDITPFDYEKVLAPQSADDAAAELDDAAASAAEVDEDEVPF